ncbi:MAG: PD40 domain-containing protein [Muribaculaceae bacterium]|nr:PD40 domain-containing protein [Muribaculaceae bacterium]
MKKALIMLALASVFSMNAQIATVVSKTPILKGVETDMNSPVLSPDGTKLLFCSANYSNLRMLDFATGEVNVVAKDDRSGFDALFTPDSREIYFVTERDGEGGLKMRQLKKYDVAKGETVALSDEMRLVRRPAVSDKGFSVNTDKKSLKKGSVGIAVRVEDSRLIITRNGVDHEYSPVEAYAGYLWPTLSPDRTKVAFVAAGKGVYVTDLEGNILAHLDNRRYEAPSWYGNDFIITQLTTDDGHQLHSSQLVINRADGSASQALTAPESMTMSPAADIDNNRIIYATVDGLLYEMKININK